MLGKIVLGVDPLYIMYCVLRSLFTNECSIHNLEYIQIDEMFD